MGIDLQEISAVKGLMIAIHVLQKKVLTSKEWERFESLSGSRQMSHLAGRWAGKEAFQKLGELELERSVWDIEILNNDKGAPVVTQSPFEGKVFDLDFP